MHVGKREFGVPRPSRYKTEGLVQTPLVEGDGFTRDSVVVCSRAFGRGALRVDEAVSAELFLDPEAIAIARDLSLNNASSQPRAEVIHCARMHAHCMHSHFAHC